MPWFGKKFLRRGGSSAVLGEKDDETPRKPQRERRVSKRTQRREDNPQQSDHKKQELLSKFKLKGWTKQLVGSLAAEAAPKKPVRSTGSPLKQKKEESINQFICAQDGSQRLWHSRSSLSSKPDSTPRKPSRFGLTELQGGFQDGSTSTMTTAASSQFSNDSSRSLSLGFEGEDDTPYEGEKDEAPIVMFDVDEMNETSTNSENSIDVDDLCRIRRREQVDEDSMSEEDDEPRGRGIRWCETVDEELERRRVWYLHNSPKIPERYTKTRTRRQLVFEYPAQLHEKDQPMRDESATSTGAVVIEYSWRKSYRDSDEDSVSSDSSSDEDSDSDSDDDEALELVSDDSDSDSDDEDVYYDDN